jgi:hypothetical protein
VTKVTIPLWAGPAECCMKEVRNANERRKSAR